MQCLHRYQKVLFPGRKNESWSPEEDIIISEEVKKYGPKNWSKIAKRLDGRIGKQCRERWHNHLNPQIKQNERWNDTEEKLVFLCHKKLGNQWSKISKFLNCRSDNNIKNYMNSTMKKKIPYYEKWSKEAIGLKLQGTTRQLDDAIDELIKELKSENDQLNLEFFKQSSHLEEEENARQMNIQENIEIFNIENEDFCPIIETPHKKEEISIKSPSNRYAASTRITDKTYYLKTSLYFSNYSNSNSENNSNNRNTNSLIKTQTKGTGVKFQAFQPTSSFYERSENKLESK